MLKEERKKCERAKINFSLPQTIWITPNPAGLRELSALLAKGTLSIRIGATFALDQAAEAHRLAESHTVAGKIVLIP